MNYQHLEVKKFKNRGVMDCLCSYKDKIEEGAHPAPVKKLVKKLLIDKNLL